MPEGDCFVSALANHEWLLPEGFVGGDDGLELAAAVLLKRARNKSVMGIPTWMSGRWRPHLPISRQREWSMVAAAIKPAMNAACTPGPATSWPASSSPGTGVRKRTALLPKLSALAEGSGRRRPADARADHNGVPGGNVQIRFHSSQFALRRY